MNVIVANDIKNGTKLTFEHELRRFVIFFCFCFHDDYAEDSKV